MLGKYLFAILGIVIIISFIILLISTLTRHDKQIKELYKLIDKKESEESSKTK